MNTSTKLKSMLHDIHRKSYPVYKTLKGQYQFDKYVLQIDHVQGDPFASPSKVSVLVTAQDAKFPQQCFEKEHIRIAMQDFLLRQFAREIEKYNRKAKGSGKSGVLSISRPNQVVLERSACEFLRDGSLIVRMEIGFPAKGRTIDSVELEHILYEYLPKCIHTSLYYKSLSKDSIRDVVELAIDQYEIRQQLEKQKLVAFVANGSILPRESGVSDKPMKNCVPFISPKEHEVTLHLPHRGEVKGMGIPQGITLIVGGGYHGKSTLLKALELGVYNHIAGDGRELVITKADAMKMRAEDGRSVSNTDISMFINHLPNGKDTVNFSTPDASGSTSQAANVVEAIEAGTSLLLIDEDTSATNFMVRDELMQRVVNRSEEPITPFLERACFLYEKFGVSTILVAGSSGAYFHIADVIIQMEQYIPKDITEYAKEVAMSFPLSSSQPEQPHELQFHRIPQYGGGERLQKTSNEQETSGETSDRNFDAENHDTFKRQNKHHEKHHEKHYGKHQRDKAERVKIKTHGTDGISLNHDMIELRYIEQIVDSEQVTVLGHMIVYALKNLFDGKLTVQDIVNEVYKQIERNGFSSITDNNVNCGLALPRRQEFFACINRCRQI